MVDIYKVQRNYENINRMLFNGAGKYNIPIIKPVNDYITTEWIGFNYVNSTGDTKNKGVHFFLDDYQFIRLWNNIDRYIGSFKKFRYIMSPDFSLFTDFPVAMQIYNHYRKHWIAAYLQEFGIKVIPTICWSNEVSYEWCFDGEPLNSVVAVSSVGTQKDQKSKQMFLEGYNEMIRRLSPERIIFYGAIPNECKGNISRIKAYQEKFKEANCYGW